MKKTIYTLTLGLGLLFFGCEDQLERLPVDSLSITNAYNTVSDLQRNLNEAIDRISYNGIIAHNSIFTDNCKLGVDNGGQQTALLNQLLDSNTNGSGIWDNRYLAINGFNRIIEASSNVDASSDQATFDFVLAQSYAFRALCHSELLLYFGLDYEDPNALGVPYVKEVSGVATPPRNTTQEVIDAIEEDLTIAENLLAGTTSDVNFANVDMINFLRARVALYSGNYQDAIDLADDLIASYPLANTTQYTNMFNSNEDTTEVIFKLDNVFGSNDLIAGTWLFTGTGGSFMEMSASLESELLTNDVRRDVNLDPNESDVADNLFVIGKYPAGADTNYINDYKAMRISEMYLIRAEAHVRKQTPNYPAAIADVDAVRNARLLSGTQTSSFSNLVDAITAIKLERRLELAYEGHRYIDLKRYRNILNEGIVRDPSDCTGAIPCTLPVNSIKWIFPIPQSEINGNPNITQAPGY